jgi:hypothetical protein
MTLQKKSYLSTLKIRIAFVKHLNTHVIKSTLFDSQSVILPILDVH